MGQLVTPDVYLVGYTTIDYNGLKTYLEDSGNTEFLDYIEKAKEQGLSDGEIICSFYAKLCYASLTLGHNSNISRLRDISDNLIACFDQGHGSVFEHTTLNFVIRNCSRVFTHELVRHRVGTAFSQTSGRYVRNDSIDIVFDPVLEPIKDLIQTVQNLVEVYYKEAITRMNLNNIKDFTTKKKITSALRRLLPNGQTNEIGFSVNIRALRHTVQFRTSRHAEWEIRYIFNQIYKIVKNKYPLIFYDAYEEIIDDLLEVSGMNM
jgi:thymidylate synthase (FAD)